LAVAATIFFTGASLAQTSAINGAVKGDDGKGLQGALIKIERKDIRGNYKVKTNKKGEYYYGGLPLGTYDITVEVNGQDVDRVSGVRTRLGEPQTVDFDLQKLKARQAALQQAAETGQLSAEQARELSPEQREAMKKRLEEQQKAMAKNKALNDAFNTGMQALQSAGSAGQAEKATHYTTAIDAFKKAGEMDPKQHVVWAHLGDAYIGLSQVKTGPEQEQALNEGVGAWNKAIELLPNDAGYHNNFALALARAKKFPEAQAELEKAASLDPTQAGKYYYNLGALLVNNGQSEPAGEAFKKAIEADPNYANAHYQYGMYLVGKAQLSSDGKITPPPGTKEAFETYLKLDPTGAFADSAKSMLQTIEGTVQTEYTNPAAKKGKKK
jgi:tetratricopeptide (TPR) repeat protein